jgi:hypothetical protein
MTFQVEPNGNHRSFIGFGSCRLLVLLQNHRLRTADVAPDSQPTASYTRLTLSR